MIWPRKFACRTIKDNVFVSKSLLSLLLRSAKCKQHICDLSKWHGVLKTKSDLAIYILRTRHSVQQIIFTFILECQPNKISLTFCPTNTIVLTLSSKKEYHIIFCHFLFRVLFSVVSFYWKMISLKELWTSQEKNST